MSVGAFEQRDHPHERLTLTLDVIGAAHRGADVQAPDHLTWRTGATAERWHHAHQHGRYPFGFQAACDQTHGLMADGSNRDHDGHRASHPAVTRTPCAFSPKRLAEALPRKDANEQVDYMLRLNWLNLLNTKSCREDC